MVATLHFFYTYPRVPECHSGVSGSTNSSHPSVSDAIIRHHRLKHFHGGRTKKQAYLNSGRPVTDFLFVQLNPSSYLNFLVVDVDHGDAELRILHPSVPQPHWIIVNPDNGHAQAGWMIEPVARTPEARAKPQAYADAVQCALDNLTGADRAFTGHLVRNPVADTPAGHVRFGARLTPYPLGELAKHMQEYRDPFDPDLQAWVPRRRFSLGNAVKGQSVAIGSRNDTLFRATRAHLKDRLLHEGLPPTDQASHEYASALNSQLMAPLSLSEVRGLAASAVRQVKKHQGRQGGASVGGGAYRRFCAIAGRAGGSVKSEKKRVAAVANGRRGGAALRAKTAARTGQASKLLEEGRSIAEIAESMQCSPATVRRWFRSHGVVSKPEATGSGSTGLHSPTGVTPPLQVEESLHHVCVAEADSPGEIATPIKFRGVWTEDQRTALRTPPLGAERSAFPVVLPGTVEGPAVHGALSPRAESLIHRRSVTHASNPYGLPMTVTLTGNPYRHGLPRTTSTSV